MSRTRHLAIFQLSLVLLGCLSISFTMTLHDNIDHLRLYFVTWNVATKDPSEELYSLLNLPKDDTKKEKLADMYIIGLQEVRSQVTDLIKNMVIDDPWTERFRDVLKNYDYVKLHTTKMQGIIINAFVLRKHIGHLRLMEWQYTKTGFNGFWGNKGAVSIRMNLYGVSVCFVNSHLPAHDEALQSRIDDYDIIMKTHLFKNEETRHIIYHDYVFWIGDLNFRLNEGLSAADIELLVKKRDLATLLSKDQLMIVREKNAAFSELIEEKITFPPTYKYEFGTQAFDLKRRPSWTDRILYKVNNVSYVENHLKAIQLSYTSHPSYLQSDHKPVTAEFDVFIKPNFTEQSVKLKVSSWYLDEENTVKLEFLGGYQPEMTDYVALFHTDFSNIEDYVFYEYVRGTNGGEEHITDTIIFPFIAAKSPGLYRLVYFSQKQCALSILGVSSAFNIEPKNDPTVQICNNSVQE